jgi:very-short-patch-repair endonuclease
MSLEEAGFLVIRAKERVVRDGIDHVLAWITEVGELLTAKRTVTDQLRRMDTVPLP